MRTADRARRRRRAVGGADRARTRSGAAAQAGRGRDAARRGLLDLGGAREAPGGLRVAGSRQGPRVSRPEPRFSVAACVIVGAILGVILGSVHLAPGPAEALERLPSVLHLHSDLSTGDFSLERLTAMAEQQNIGALLLTENYLLRIEWGLPPF